MVVGTDSIGTISGKISKENAAIETYVSTQDKSFIKANDDGAFYRLAIKPDDVNLSKK